MTGLRGTRRRDWGAISFSLSPRRAAYLEMDRNSRNALIDGLRGAAASAVALFHFHANLASQGTAYEAVWRWGWLGVSVFFVVSGFCIAQARRRDGLLEFWWKRLLRIYPPFWGSLVLVVLIVLGRKVIWGVNDITPLPGSAGAIVATVAGMTDPATAIPTVNWVYWSLTYEIAFYVIAGLALIGESAWGAVAVGVVALALRGLGYPFVYWGLFSMGIGASFYCANRRAAGGVIIALGAVHTFLAQTPAQGIAGTATVLLILFPPAIVAGAWFRPARWLGQISYSLYLLHVPVGCYVLSAVLRNVFPAGLAGMVARDAVLLAACVGAAYGFYRVIERPSHELARRGLRPTAPRPGRDPGSLLVDDVVAAPTAGIQRGRVDDQQRGLDRVP